MGAGLLIQAQPYTRGLFGENGRELVAEHRRRVVGHQHGELPAGGGGVEDGDGVENPLDPDEGRGGRFPELFGQGGEFGIAPTGLTADERGVDIDFSDGSASRYDLVVGADGIHSWTRRTLGMDTEPQPTGMGIWRLFAPRPASITRTDLFYGGPAYIAGYCPTGPDTLYAYLVEDARDEARPPTPEQGLAAMLELAAAYHGPWDEVRASMTDPDRINYAKFESHVIDGPWHRGRVVLIGDAAHSCPPTLAQGCAQALEDAAVLAELLIAHDAVSEDLWREFTDRRLPRAKDVVESSVQLGQWLLAGEQGDVAGLMTRISRLVADPA